MAKPRSILIVNQFFHPEPAATAFVAADLARHWAARGHRVEALCGRGGYQEGGRRALSRREVWEGVGIRRVYSLAGGKKNVLSRVADYASFYLRAAAWIAARPRWDLIVSLTTPPFIFGTALLHRRLWGSKVWLWAMDLYPDVAEELGALQRGGLGARALRGVNRVGLAGLDLAVALDPEMGERLREAGAPRIAVVRNWTRSGKWDQATPEAARAFRERRGVDPGELLVLYLGNMGLGHEFGTVLEAAARLQAQGAPVRFLFLGGGKRAGEIRERAAALGLRSVAVDGWVPDDEAVAALAAADVGLITQLDAMVGLITPSKLYSLLAAGLPVLFVGPDRCEMSRVVDQAGCGAHVPIGRDEDLAAWLAGAVADRAGLRAAGLRGRDAFLARWEYAHAMARFDTLLERSFAGRLGAWEEP